VAEATRGENMNARRARRVAIRILDEFEELMDAQSVTILSSDSEGIDEDPLLPDRWNWRRMMTGGEHERQRASAALSMSNRGLCPICALLGSEIRHLPPFVSLAVTWDAVLRRRRKHRQGKD